MKRKNTMTCLATATLALCAQSALAQYSLDWQTIDGGGGVCTAGAYTLSGTIGQPDAGLLTGGNFTLAGGFWAGPAVRPPCPADIDGDNVIGLSDLATLLAHFGAPGAHQNGDINEDGVVNLVDLAQLLTVFGTACP